MWRGECEVSCDRHVYEAIVYEAIVSEKLGV